MVDTFEDFLKFPGRGDPYHFGLGFIKCRLNDSQSVNFYHPNLEVTADKEEWHDHRYDFHSQVVRGVLTNDVVPVTFLKSDNKTWIDVVATHDAWKAECKEGEEMESFGPVMVRPDEICTFTMKAGSNYFLSKDTFHRVAPGPKGAVTVLTRSRVLKKWARVLTPRGAGAPTCPYSPKKTQEELFKMIRELYEV